MMRLADIAILFHSLAGLCAGWFLGASRGWLSGLILAAVGCAIGMAAGFLIGRVPRAIRLAGEQIPPKHRVLATVLAACGVIVGVVFWSACFHCAGL